MSNLSPKTSSAENQQVWELVDRTEAGNYKVVFLKNRNISIGLPEDFEKREEFFIKIEKSFLPFLSKDKINNVEFFVEKSADQQEDVAYCQLTDAQGVTTRKKLSEISRGVSSDVNPTIRKLHDFSIDYFETQDEEDFLLEIFSQVCALLASPFVFLYDLLVHPYDPIKQKVQAIAEVENIGEKAVSYQSFLHHLRFTHDIIDETFDSEDNSEGAQLATQTLKILNDSVEFGQILQTAHTTPVETEKKALLQQLSGNLANKVSNKKTFILPLRLHEDNTFSPSLLLFVCRADGTYVAHNITHLPSVAEPRKNKHTDIQSWVVSDDCLLAENVESFFYELLVLHTPHQISTERVKDGVERTDLIRSFFDSPRDPTVEFPFLRGQEIISVHLESNRTRDPLETIFSAMNLLSGDGDIDIFSTRAKFFHAFFQKFISYLNENDSVLNSEERIHALEGLRFYAGRTKLYLEEEIGPANAEKVLGQLNVILDQQLQDHELSRLYQQDQVQGLDQRGLQPALQGARLEGAFPKLKKEQALAKSDENVGQMAAICSKSHDNIERLNAAFNTPALTLDEKEARVQAVYRALKAIETEAESFLNKKSKEGAEEARILLTGIVKLFPIEQEKYAFWDEIPLYKIDAFTDVIGSISEKFFEAIGRSDHSLLEPEQYFPKSTEQTFEFGAVLQLIINKLALRKLDRATQRFDDEFLGKTNALDVPQPEFQTFSRNVKKEVIEELLFTTKLSIEKHRKEEIEKLEKKINSKIKKIKRLEAKRRQAVKQAEETRKNIERSLNKQNNSFNLNYECFSTVDINYDNSVSLRKRNDFLKALSSALPILNKFESGDLRIFEKFVNDYSLKTGWLDKEELIEKDLLPLFAKYRFIKSSHLEDLRRYPNRIADAIRSELEGGYVTTSPVTNECLPLIKLFTLIFSADNKQELMNDFINRADFNQMKARFVGEVKTVFDGSIAAIDARLIELRRKKDTYQARFDLLKNQNVEQALIQPLRSFLEVTYARLGTGEMLQDCINTTNASFNRMQAIQEAVERLIVLDADALSAFLDTLPTTNAATFQDNLPNEFIRGVSSRLDILAIFNRGRGSEIYQFYLGRLLKHLEVSSETLGEYLDVVNNFDDILPTQQKMAHTLLRNDCTITFDTNELQNRYEGAQAFYQHLCRQHIPNQRARRLIHTYKYLDDKLLPATYMQMLERQPHSEALINGYQMTHTPDKQYPDPAQVVLSKEERQNLARLHMRNATACVDPDEFDEDNENPRPLVSRQRAWMKKLKIMREILLHPSNVFSEFRADGVTKLLRPSLKTAKDAILKKNVLIPMSNQPRIFLKAYENFIKLEVTSAIEKLSNPAIHGCYSPGFAICSTHSSKVKATHVVEDENVQYLLQEALSPNGMGPYWVEVERASKSFFGRRGTSCMEGYGSNRLTGQNKQESDKVIDCENDQATLKDAAFMQKLADSLLALGAKENLSTNTIIQIFHFIQSPDYRALLAEENASFERLYDLLYQKNLLKECLNLNRHLLPGFLQLFRQALIELKKKKDLNALAILFVNLFFDSVRSWIDSNIREGDDDFETISQLVNMISLGKDRIGHASVVFSELSNTSKQKFGCYFYLTVWNRLAENRPVMSEEIAKELIKARFLLKESKITGGHPTIDASIEQIWGEQILAEIEKNCLGFEKDGTKNQDVYDRSTLLHWIASQHSSVENPILWEKDPTKGAYVYTAKCKRKKDNVETTETLVIDLQKLNGNVDGLFGFVQNSTSGELPKEVRRNPLFINIFGDNFHPQVKISKRGVCDEFQWRDNDKRIDYTVLFERQNNSVKIIQKLPSGKSYIYSNNKIPNNAAQSFAYSFFLDSSQDMSQLDRMVNEKGMWIELDSEGTEIKPGGRVLVAVSDQDLQYDPLILDVDIVEKGETFLGLQIRDEKLTIMTIRGAHIGEGSDKKQLYTGSAELPVLLCRELAGVLLLGRNNKLEEIRIPSVKEYSRVFQDESQRSKATNLEDSSGLILVRNKKNPNEWYVKGQAEWKWQIESNKHLEDLFGINWRQYVLPLFNEKTKMYKYYIFPYLAFTDGTGTSSEITVVRNIVQLFDSLGAKAFLDLIKPLLNKAIHDDPTLNNFFGGIFPVDLMPQAIEILVKKAQESFATSKIVSTGLKAITDDDFIHMLIKKPEGMTEEMYEGVKTKVKTLFSGALLCLVPHSFTLTENSEGEDSTHFGFFYLSHLQSLRGNYSQAQKYLEQMMTRGVSNDHAVKEFHQKLLPLLGLPTTSQFLKGIDVYTLLKGFGGESGDQGTYEPILENLLDSMLSIRSGKDTAFRIKQIYSLITISKRLAVLSPNQTHIFGNTEASRRGAEMFLKIYAAILYSNYRKTFKNHWETLRDEHLLLTKEEEGFLEMVHKYVYSQILNFQAKLGEAVGIDGGLIEDPNLQAGVPGAAATAQFSWVFKNPKVQELFMMDSAINEKSLLDLHEKNQIPYKGVMPTKDEMNQLAIAADYLRGNPSLTTVKAIHDKFGQRPSWQTLVAHFPVYVDWVLNHVSSESELEFLKAPLHTLDDPLESELEAGEDPDLPIVEALPVAYMNPRKAIHSAHVDTARKLLIYLYRMKKVPEHNQTLVPNGKPKVEDWKKESEKILLAMKKDKCSHFYQFHDRLNNKLKTCFAHPTLFTLQGYFVERFKTTWELLGLAPNKEGNLSEYRQNLLLFFQEFHTDLVSTNSVHENNANAPLPILNLPKPPISSLPTQLEKLTREDIHELMLNMIVTIVSIGDVDQMRSIFSKLVENDPSQAASAMLFEIVIAGLTPYLGKEDKEKEIKQLFLGQPFAFFLNLCVDLTHAAYNKEFPDSLFAETPEKRKKHETIATGLKVMQAFAAYTSKSAPIEECFKRAIPALTKFLNTPQLTEFIMGLVDDPEAMLQLAQGFSEMSEQDVESLKGFQYLQNFIVEEFLKPKAKTSPKALKRKEKEKYREITSIAVPITKSYQADRRFFEECFVESRSNFYADRFAVYEEKLLKKVVKKDADKDADDLGSDDRVVHKEKGVLDGLRQKRDELQERMKKSSLRYSEVEVLEAKITEIFQLRKDRAITLAKTLLELSDRYQNILGLTPLFLHNDANKQRQILHALFDLYQEGKLYCLKDIKEQCEFEQLITEYLFVKTEMQQLKESFSILTKMKGIAVGVINKEKAKKGFTFLKVQDYLNNDNEWRLRGLELKGALLKGSDRYRFCHYNDNRQDRSHPNNGTLPIMEQPDFTRRYLVKEYHNGWISREKAIEALDLLLGDFKKALTKKEPVRFVNVRMGIGKTSFIFPQAAKICTQHGKDAVVMTTSQLVDQLHGELGHQAFRFDFDSNFGIPVPEGEKPDTKVVITHLKNLLKNLEGLKERENFVVTTPTARAAVINKIVELQDQLPFYSSFAENGLGNQNSNLLFVQLQLVQRIEEFFKKEDTVTFQDEDINLDVTFEYNKATGKNTRYFDRIIYNTAEKVTHELLASSVLSKKLFNNRLRELPLSTMDKYPEIYEAISEMLDQGIEDKALITKSVLHAQAYLVLKIIRDKEYWIRKSGGSLAFQGSGFTEEEVKTWLEQDEQGKLTERAKLKEFEIFDFIFSHKKASPDEKILEGILPPEGFDPSNKDHDKFKYFAALKSLMGENKPFQTVYKINAVLARGSCTKSGLEISPYQDEIEKKNVHYGNELESVLHHFMAYAKGGKEFHSRTIFRKQMMLFAEDSDTSIELAPDVVISLKSNDKIAKMRKELGLEPAKNWMEWKANISKVMSNSGITSEYDVFSGIVPQGQELRCDPSIYKGILALERMQYLKWAAYESSRIKIYPEQYVCNSQAIPNEDVRVASGTGNVFDLNLAKIGDQSQDVEQVIGETLMLTNPDQAAVLFKDAQQHIEECVADPQCAAVVNLDYEVMGGNPTALISYLRNLPAGKKRQFHWRVRIEDAAGNTKFIRRSWDPGEQEQPRDYSPDLVNDKTAFFYYAPCDSRGVDFRVPRKGQYASMMAGLATDDDIFNQGVGRMRQLGFGQNFRCAIDEKMLKRVCKQNSNIVLGPNQMVTTWEVMRSIWRNTLIMKEFIHVKAAVFKAKNIVAGKLNRVSKAPLKLDDLDYEIIEKSKDPEIVKILDQLQRVIFQATRGLYCQRSDIEWGQTFSPQEKHKCMDFLQITHENVERNLVRMQKDFRRRLAAALYLQDKRLRAPYDTLPDVAKEHTKEEVSATVTEIMSPYIDGKNSADLEKMNAILLKRPQFSKFYEKHGGDQANDTAETRKATWIRIQESLIRICIESPNDLFGLLNEAVTHEEMTPFDQVLIEIFLLKNQKISQYLDTLMFLSPEDFKNKIGKSGDFRTVVSRSMTNMMSQLGRQERLDNMDPRASHRDVLETTHWNKVLLNYWQKVYNFEQACRKAKYELLVAKTLLGNVDAKHQLERSITDLLPDQRALVLRDLLETEFGFSIQDYLKSVANPKVGVAHPSISAQIKAVSDHYKARIGEVPASASAGNGDNEQQVEMSQETDVEMEIEQELERQVSPINLQRYSLAIDIRSFHLVAAPAQRTFDTPIEFPARLFGRKNSLFAVSKRSKDFFESIGRREVDAPYLLVFQDGANIRACIVTPSDLEDEIGRYIDDLNRRNTECFMKLYPLYGSLQERQGDKYGLPSLVLKGTKKEGRERTLNSDAKRKLDAEVLKMYSLAKLYIGINLKDYTTAEIASIIHIAAGTDTQLNNFLNDGGGQAFRAYESPAAIKAGDQFASISFIEQIRTLWGNLDAPTLTFEDLQKMEMEFNPRLFNLVLDMRLIYREKNNQCDVAELNLAERYQILHHLINGNANADYCPNLRLLKDARQHMFNNPEVVASIQKMAATDYPMEKRVKDMDKILKKLSYDKVSVPDALEGGRIPLDQVIQLLQQIEKHK